MAGFPNMLMVLGPHTARGNIPRCIEQNVDFVTTLIAASRAEGLHAGSTAPEAESAWTNHVMQIAAKLLITQIDSWFTGINSQHRRVGTSGWSSLYAGGAPRYRKKCDEVAAAGYAGFTFR